MEFIEQQKNQLLNYFKDKNIAVLYGGMSEERDVSLRSGINVYNALKSFDELKNNIYLIDVVDGHSLVQKIKEYKIDYCYNILHGTYGEDGKVQGLLDMLSLPYTGEGTTTSALCMDKVKTKIIWNASSILNAKFDLLANYISRDDNSLQFSTGNSIKFPLIIKPIENGSSVNLFLLHNASEFDNLISSIKDNEKNQYFVEEYIRGKEYTAGIIPTPDGKHHILPILAILPKNEMYDYQAKYTKGMTNFEVPAKIDKILEHEVLEIIENAYKSLNAKGLCRIDFIIDDNNRIYLLECNTQPGMTETSDVPEMAKASNINFNNLVLYILGLSKK